MSQVIERSPESAKLVVFASNGFLSDQITRMVGSADGTFYTNSVQMIANAVDWALEDATLLSIRARGNFNRTLPPMADDRQTFIETLNYLFAIAGVVLVYLIFRMRRTGRKQRHAKWFAEART